jgi:S1-C subfamily serine protease
MLLIAGAGVGGWLIIRAKKRENATPQTTEEARAKASNAEQVYKSLLKSSALVIGKRADRNGNSLGTVIGSGNLLHRDRRLVLTNNHVVEGCTVVNLYFPDYAEDTGSLITDSAHYAVKMDTIRINTKVVATDPQRDLALLELDRLPPHVQSLRLAAKPAGTGANLFSIGASGVGGKFEGSLWRFSTGTARGRFRDKGQLQNGQHIDAMILESQKPVNPGDSGGASVDEHCELVGVVCAGLPGKDLVKYDIDVTEVREFLAEFANKGNWTWVDLPPNASPDVSPTERPPGIPEFMTAAKSGDVEKRLDAIKTLGQMHQEAKKAVPLVIGLLDDPNDRIRRASASSLESIGPPNTEDLGSLEKALPGTQKAAKLYALRYYSTLAKLKREQLPQLLEILDDEQTELREQALLAIAFYGPECKTVLLDKLLHKILDTDPAVAGLALQIVNSFAPFEGEERKVLVTNLTGKEPFLKCVSIQLLAPVAPDGSMALEWFRPLLDDPNPLFREQAIIAIARWGQTSRPALPDLIIRTRDDNPKVRVAAVHALGELQGGPGAIEAAGKCYEASDEPVLKATAARTLVRLDFKDPEKDLPVLGRLLADTDAAIKLATLKKLSLFGAAVEPFLSRVVASLQDPNPDIQIAALKVIAAAGTKASPLAAQVARMLTTTPAAIAPMSPTILAPKGEQLADRLTRSSAWVLIERFGRPVGHGSAVLVDRRTRLLLTNHHLVSASDSLMVFFPYRTAGELKTSPEYYRSNISNLARGGYAQTARVVVTDPTTDLAVIQTEGNLPEEKTPLSC